MPEDEAGQAEAHARGVLAEMQERLANGAHAALGVPTHATSSDIRAAFLALTKRYHPARFGRMPTDVQRLSTEVFLALRSAHDSLAKKNSRTTGLGIPAVAPVAAAPTLRPTAQMPPLARPPAGNAPPTRPTPSSLTAPRSPTTPTTPAPPGPRRAPTAAPPPNGPERRSTPALGVRVVAKPLQPTPAPTAKASGTLPILDRELAPIYDLMQRGQWDQARLAIAGLAERGSEAARYEALMHYTRGREAQLERRIDEARVELDSALQLDPNLQIAKTALAELFTRRK